MERGTDPCANAFDVPIPRQQLPRQASPAIVVESRWRGMGDKGGSFARIGLDPV
jgi:hypothetical protein